MVSLRVDNRGVWNVWDSGRPSKPGCANTRVCGRADSEAHGLQNHRVHLLDVKPLNGNFPAATSHGSKQIR